MADAGVVARFGLGAVLIGTLTIVGTRVSGSVLRYTGDDLGPTAATFREAFNAMVGGGLGLLVAVAVVAALTSRRPVPVALAAAAVAFLLAIVPNIFVSAPTDFSRLEPLLTAAALAPFYAAVVAAGAWLGALAGRLRPQPA